LGVAFLAVFAVWQSGPQAAVADPRGDRIAAAGRVDPDTAVAPGHPRHLPERAITPRAGRDAAAPDAVRGRAGGSWWGSLASLAAVLGMIVLGARLWKKHGPLGRPGLPGEALEVLGRRILDPRQSIYLVRLGSRILVLGATPAGLSTLSEITDPVEVDVLAGLCRPPVEERPPGARQSFAALFSGHAAAPGSPPGRFAAASGSGVHPANSVTEHRRRPEEAHA
jgi:flagellar biogenesis protein FliO